MPTSPRAARRCRSWVLPAAMGAWAVVPVLDTTNTYSGPQLPWAIIPATALVVGLASTVRHPIAGWVVTTATLAGVAGLTAPRFPGSELPGWFWVAWWPVLILVTRATTVRTSALVWMLSLATTLAVVSTGPWTVDPGTRLLALLLTATPLALGSVLQGRQRARAAVAAEQRRTVEARDTGVALAERARIAREMHDVVAHHMSLVAVRAETAPYRLPGLDARAVEELAEVAGAARSAMTEMQQLLGVLRSDDAAAVRPMPGTGDITALVESARAAGTNITWRTDTVDVPDGVGLTAYRVVAQGLANAAHHAAGAPVAVAVEQRGGQLRVQVRSGPGRDRGPGGGAGLPGLAERAALHGGELVAQATADGGFELVALLPLDGGGSR